MSRRRGFSLIECIVAMTILGTSVVAALELFGAQASFNLDAERRIHAYWVLNRHAETIRASRFDSLSSTAWRIDDKYTGMETRRVVTAIDANTKEILMEVRWTNSRGGTSADSAESYRCRKAP